LENLDQYESKNHIGENSVPKVPSSCQGVNAGSQGGVEQENQGRAREKKITTKSKTKFMNKPQKYLTAVCLVLFAATLTLCPWYYNDPIIHQHHQRLSLFFIQPENHYRPDLLKLWSEWFVLGVIYTGVFFLLKKSQ
jgi:hypothetical protein